MINRIAASSTLILALVLGACGGGASEPAPPPVPATSSSDALSEADAIVAAQEAATEKGISVEGMSVQPAQLFGEWQVSFEPIDTDSLGGGFLVILQADTGELLDIVSYQ